MCMYEFILQLSMYRNHRFVRKLKILFKNYTGGEEGILIEKLAVLTYALQNAGGALCCLFWESKELFFVIS